MIMIIESVMLFGQGGTPHGGRRPGDNNTKLRHVLGQTDVKTIRGERCVIQIVWDSLLRFSMAHAYCSVLSLKCAL